MESDLIPENQSPLSAAETDRLAELVKIVDRGFGSFVEVGIALSEIRADRLYRQTHVTFEAFCQERWQISKTHANRLIQGAEVTENLTPIGVKPISESQVRPLAGLPPKVQQKVWEAAVKSSETGKPTAKDISLLILAVLGSLCKDGNHVEFVIGALGALWLWQCFDGRRHKKISAFSRL